MVIADGVGDAEHGRPGGHVAGHGGLRAYPVRFPGAVADAVSTLSPRPAGTVTENDPSAAATAVPVVDGAPVVVSSDSTTTSAPGTVVPALG